VNRDSMNFDLQERARPLVALATSQQEFKDANAEGGEISPPERTWLKGARL
jgi:hypothetical protein